MSGGFYSAQWPDRFSNPTDVVLLGPNHMQMSDPMLVVDPPTPKRAQKTDMRRERAQETAERPQSRRTNPETALEQHLAASTAPNCQIYFLTRPRWSFWDPITCKCRIRCWWSIRRSLKGPRKPKCGGKGPRKPLKGPLVTKSRPQNRRTNPETALKPHLAASTAPNGQIDCLTRPTWAF